MAYLLDTNILLRILSGDNAHPPSVEAVDRLKERGERLHFAPQNAAEFWNTATRPKNKNGFGLSPDEAETYLTEAEVLFDVLPDVPPIYPRWRRLVREAGVSGVQVHDARLVHAGGSGKGIQATSGRP